jgi:hypothetical protein
MNICYVTQGYRERELSSKLTSFTLSGLQPGETYGIQLKTKVSWILQFLTSKPPFISAVDPINLFHRSVH